MNIQSDQIDLLASALSKAQAIMESPKRVKDAYGYKYADYNECKRVIKEPFEKFGLAISHIFEEHCVTTILMHSSGQWIKSSFPIKEGDSKGKNPMQEIGSAFTYAARYGLCGLCGISGDQDNDSQLVSHAKPIVSNNPSNEVIRKLSEACKKEGIDIKEFAMFHKFTSSDQEACMDALANFDEYKEVFKKREINK